MSPRTIAGRYEVETEVGRGGMGAVWLCRDKVLGRQVAVKQLGGLPGETAPALARALREARASAALNHPHVVAIYDAVESQDHVWLVMEYVPSQTLSAILTEEGTLPPRRAAYIGAQVADGLTAAHAHGTMHRDVKPGNILVGADDHTKVSDFGIARHVDDETLTESGMVTGTPMYFSPQLARGAAPTPADDVWALGATLFAAVEGGPPWPAELNSIALLVHIAENAPPRPTAAGPLADLIGQMMSVDPADRPEMATVARRLHELAGEDTGADAATVVDEHPTVAFATPDPPTRERTPAAPPAAAPAAPPAVPPATPEGPPGRRRVLPLAAAAAAVVLVAVLGAALLLANGQQDDPSGGQDRVRTSSSRTAADDATPDADTPSGSTQAAPPPTTEQTTDSGSTAPATDAAQFVTDYYALLPDDTRSAWSLLSDGTQQEVGGYGSYSGFWDTIDSVSVDDATETSPGTVSVDLTYTSSRGTESETRQITVADTGDGLQIVGDRVS
ncbi:MAG TPA: serine/threonine-protein kinase [Nocardioides sp.]|nr:serine/threonine-protein kinase [Nocardioides sp.]